MQTTRHTNDTAREDAKNDYNSTKQNKRHPMLHDPQELGLHDHQSPDNTPGLDTVDMCPHITNACIAATHPHKIRDLIHSAIQPYLLQLLTEQDGIAHTQLVGRAIGAMDTCEAVAVMRSAALLHKTVNIAITEEARRMQNTHEPGHVPKGQVPIRVGPCEEGQEQEMATGRATIVIPCPCAWAERHHRDYKDRKFKTHGTREDLLDHAHANIARTIDCIATESSTHNPIGMGAKHPRQQTNQDQHHKDNEQHVPQLIVENLSFMAMATCQFTATTPRNRNHKEFLGLLDMVERLQDTYPGSNMDHNHCCEHCIDDCIAGQWVVLLGCGHVHHHECHHAATRNNVICTCPSCDKNQVSSQTILQARCPTPRGPTFLCLGAKSAAIPDMTTIARTHRCIPTLIFLTASPNHHNTDDVHLNNNRLQATWGCAVQIPDIACGCIGSFSTPVGLCKHQFYNIHALRTRTDPGPTSSALWITADGPTFARLSSLGLWMQSGHGEPVNTPKI